jgi:hypothetical protein
MTIQEPTREELADYGWHHTREIGEKFDLHGAEADAIAYLTLWRYQDVSGSRQSDVVGDLLLRLMHFCDRTPAYGDFATHFDRAQRTYCDSK